MFRPSEISAFRFLPHEFDPSTGVARFHYAFDDVVDFTEEMRFPLATDAAGKQLDSSDAVERALRLLSLVAGVSYYKAAVPRRAVIESGPVTRAELEFLRTLYLHGLGEFAYKNDLDLSDRPQFEATVRERAPVTADVSRRSLVAVGGGKDSCVSIESLRVEGDVLLAAVNRMRPVVDVMAASGLPSVHVDRKISPELLRINGQGALNGHVPVTAIVSLSLVVTALIHRCDAVVMSNERSASVGNVEHNGRVVNHQYSKSFEAESALASIVRNSVVSNLDYFSLLRPLSELEIARRFSKMTRYHDVFTSCNAAFRIDESRRIERWCNDCPKCRFVYLALAPFMERERLVDIFGHDILDDASQASGFDELIGWDAHKPFECVGEVEESIGALLMLTDDARWADAAIVERFRDRLMPVLTIPPEARVHPFTMSPEHLIPTRFEGALRETE